MTQGETSTGRSKMGLGCIGAFLSLFAITGLVVCGVGLWGIYQGIRSYGWARVDGTIVESKLVEHSDSDGTHASAEIRYSYTWQGQTMEGKDIRTGARISSLAGEDVARYPAGAQVTVFVDPDRPGRAVLDNGARLAHGATPLFGLLFAGIPGGLIAWGYRRQKRLRVAAGNKAQPRDVGDARAGLDSKVSSPAPLHPHGFPQRKKIKHPFISNIPIPVWLSLGLSLFFLLFLAAGVVLTLVLLRRIPLPLGASWNPWLMGSLAWLAIGFGSFGCLGIGIPLLRRLLPRHRVGPVVLGGSFWTRDRRWDCTGIAGRRAVSVLRAVVPTMFVGVSAVPLFVAGATEVGVMFKVIAGVMWAISAGMLGFVGYRVLRAVRFGASRIGFSRSPCRTGFAEACHTKLKSKYVL